MNGEQQLASSLVEDFRRAWQQNQPLLVEETLRTFGETYPLSDLSHARDLAQELVKIDLEERWRDRGQTESDDRPVANFPNRQILEDYLPALKSVLLDETGLLELLVYEFRMRQRSGERPGLDEYGSRLQQLAEAMQSGLHDQRLIETTIHPVVPASIEPETIVRQRGHNQSLPATGGLDKNDPAHAVARVLARVRPFSELSQHVREALAMHTTVREFEAGEVLFRQGDPTDCLLVVLEGEVEVCVVDGGVQHSIARLAKHAVVGEIGLLTHEARSADVTAVRAGKAAIIPKEKFDHLVGAHPRFSIAVAELVAERIGTRNIDVLFGKVIDRYQIGQRLGRGGMGVIYAATHVTSGKSAAVKMLRHDLVGDRLSLLRFHQEAEIVKGLNHPNIVRVFDEFLAYGTCFIVMELCDGVSLLQFVEAAGSLSDGMVRGIIGQIAAALAHAHSAGVAHRDLKPSNVMICRDGTVKLTDFGLARCPVNDSSLTGVSQVVGTPMYMAPEQLFGERGDERADLYSIGIVLFELVAGRMPFRSQRFNDLQCERLMWALPPANDIRPGLDGEIYNVLQSCLVKEPERRTASLHTLSQWAAPIDWSALPAGVLAPVSITGPACLQPSAVRQ